MEFQREDHYLVLKPKDLDHKLPSAVRGDISRLLIELSAYKVHPVDCVVVERGWPEYEAVWNMLEARVQATRKGQVQRYTSGGLVPPLPTGGQIPPKPAPKVDPRALDNSAPALLAQAKKHMDDRAATYDKPEGERSMAQTVDIFNRFHGTSLTEAQGWHFMQVLKDVRLFTRDTYHADSAEDGIAYCALKAEAKAKEIVA